MPGEIPETYPHNTPTNRARKIIADVLKIEERTIKTNTDLVEDLQCDSLCKIEVAMQIEEVFGIEVTDADVEELRTFSDVVRLASTGN